jgi:hypothetical protein
MTPLNFAYLPGGDLLAAGISAIERRVPTVEALLVAGAWPRLAPLELVTPAQIAALRATLAEPNDDLELALYQRLCESVGREAHARYLALCAELDSGICALEHEHRRRAT